MQICIKSKMYSLSATNKNTKLTKVKKIQTYYKSLGRKQTDTDGINDLLQQVLVGETGSDLADGLVLLVLGVVAAQQEPAVPKQYQ